ncbi:hypothetical protein MRX96_038996 [Rhipicephalus microplus]
MVDDMSIKKHVQLVGNKVFGYVDLGMEMPDDSLPEATNACVFMLVALNMRLKVPLGYFFIDSLSGSERAQLTKECISRVTSAGVIAASLTFDGAASNFSMASFLGADLRCRSPGFNTSFQCLEDCPSKVFVILDACHMIKLVRNCLGSVNHLTDIQGRKVKWSYIEALEALQQKEGLHLGNKLTKVHLEWAKQKMKVRLAVQTLSSSVADALDFCEYKLKLPQFQGAHATAEFIRIFDRLFDILNSRNPLARSFKAPLRQQNAASWKSFFHEAEEYIRGAEGCKGGYNNNPTACQFRAAYKRLLFHTEVTSSDAGNCCRDVVSILNMSSAVSLAESPTAVTSHRRSSLLEPVDDEHDYTHRVDLPQSLSAVTSAVVPYIAGFVARKVRSVTNCEECCAALESSEEPDLVRAKNRGGLVAPSKDVLEICSIAEKGLRVLQHECKNLKSLNTSSDSLLVHVMTAVFEKALFAQLEPHLLNCDPLDNHIYSLSKKIASVYIRTRLHHISRRMNQENCNKNVRTLLTREIIFKNL